MLICLFMQCPRCRTENREQRRFCAECGTQLNLACAVCCFANEPEEKFCGGCGTPIAAASSSPESKFSSPNLYTPKYLAEKILQSKTALEGERKQVTTLFCDIANSTVLANRLGPEDMHELLNRFFELALSEVHRYEGTINQFLGDGFMALFGAPLAHEDHARRAALAALDIQNELEALVVQTGQPIKVRMGWNSGAVVIGAIGDNFPHQFPLGQYITLRQPQPCLHALSFLLHHPDKAHQELLQQVLENIAYAYQRLAMI